MRGWRKAGRGILSILLAAALTAGTMGGGLSSVYAMEEGTGRSAAAEAAAGQQTSRSEQTGGKSVSLSADGKGVQTTGDAEAAGGAEGSGGRQGSGSTEGAESTEGMGSSGQSEGSAASEGRGEAENQEGKGSGASAGTDGTENPGIGAETDDYEKSEGAKGSEGAGDPDGSEGAEGLEGSAGAEGSEGSEGSAGSAGAEGSEGETPVYHVTVTTQVLGDDPSILLSSVSPADFCEGTEVQVSVIYTGEDIWMASVTGKTDGAELEAIVTVDSVSFTMPADDVEVLLTERESQNLGDLSAEDGSIDGDWQGSTTATKKENEPDIELSKSARWTDIEDGYAELTLTEKDTSDYSNTPVDYIIILDRTRTMSLDNTVWEQGGYAQIVNENSPCINRNHYYSRNGSKLWLVDYFTGIRTSDGQWVSNLSGGASVWSGCHYNASGQKIAVSYGNGCQDRLTMARQAIYELADQVAEDNAAVAAGGKKSRLAFWSFAQWLQGASQGYAAKGIFNYTDWTTDYEAVKKAVSQVKTYAGTYYYMSLQEAYQMIEERNRTDSAHQNVYTKVVFLSDGICGDNTEGSGHSREEVLSCAGKIKSLPNTELFTVAIGMPSGSEGAKFLAGMATQKSDGTYTASIWNNMSFSGGDGSALAKTLLNINAKSIEVKAADKVLTDQIETGYWEVLGAEAASGSGSVSVDTDSGRLTWRIPEGQGKTYSCTVKLKLKDSYRYLLSDTAYPTNRDEAKTQDEIEKDPTKAGAVMRYTIAGGPYDNQSRDSGVITPKLKYGTVRVTGKKNWTVSGSQAQNVTVKLLQTLPSAGKARQINNLTVNASNRWTYTFTARLLADGSKKPLILYDEKGRTVQYEVTETVPEGYVQLESLTETKKEDTSDTSGGLLIDTQLFNEPYKLRVQLQKTDQETGHPLSGAEFSVYVWSKQKNAWLPYSGRTDKGSEPHETGAMTGADAMRLTESTGDGKKGLYTTPGWLYYAPDNQGRYRIIETLAPKGYYGDWAEGETITAASTDAQKRVYDIDLLQEITEAAKSGSTLSIGNQEDGSFGNTRVLGSLHFVKLDKETRNKTPQGDASLTGAVYRLYAAEDIVHADGCGEVIYPAGTEITVSYVGAKEGVRTYRCDPEGHAPLEMGSCLAIIIQNLELGSYYLQEAKAGEGYLIDPTKYPVELTYQDEKTAVAELKDYPVCDQVMKQSLTFYKASGSDRDTQLNLLAGAGFSAYLVSDLADGKYAGIADADLPSQILEDYRDTYTLRYDSLKSEQSAAEEMFSDEQGMVKTPLLPYGRYLFVETTVPEGYQAARPFVFTVTADQTDGTTEGDGRGTSPTTVVLPMDKQVRAYIRVTKTDAQSGKAVLREGAAYVIHDVEGAWLKYWSADRTAAEIQAYREKYQDLVVQYSSGGLVGTEETPFKTQRIASETDSTNNVWLSTAQALPCGLYELEEIAAPEGYIVQGSEGVIAKDDTLDTGNRTYYEAEEEGQWTPTPQKAVRFVVSSEDARYDAAAGTYVVEVKQKNEPAVGKISIYAEGEYLEKATRDKGTLAERLKAALNRIFGDSSAESDWESYRDYSFSYGMHPIEGARFAIHAAKDIYSPEGGDNAQCLYHAGDLVTTLTTDAEGRTWTGQEDWPDTDIAQGLPLGSYTVTQIFAGEGFALTEENAAPRSITITYAGQEVPVIYRDTAYTNPRQKVSIAVTKKDANQENLLAGAVFGMYAAENIANYEGEIVVEQGTLIAAAMTETGEDGSIQPAVFAPDLPLGRYELRELAAPEGYVPTEEVMTIDASWQEEQGEILILTETVLNTRGETLEEPKKEDTPKPSAKSSGSGGHSSKTPIQAAKTGDDTVLQPYLIGTGIGVIGLLAAGCWLMRRRREARDTVN